MPVRYTREHEWIRYDESLGTVGITNYAQEQLGDVVFVELPEVGTSVRQGDQAAVVESVKAASEVYAPASGEITEVNTALADDPALVNTSAMGDGWFFKLRLENPTEIDALLDNKAYQDLLDTLE